MSIHNPIIILKIDNLLRPESQKTPAICKQNIAASGLDNLKLLSEKLTNVLSEQENTYFKSQKKRTVRH